jgi:hypothetical protein
MGAVSPARAAELEVAVACPGWTPEAAAQVEARIRTSFLTEGLEVRRVLVSCTPDATSVQVEAERGSLVRVVEHRSGVLEDDVVATAQDALRELAQPPSPETKPDVEPEVPPATAPAGSAEPAPEVAAPARKERSTSEQATPSAPLALHVEAGPLVEVWSKLGAVGAEAAVFASNRRALRLGLAVGGRAALGEPSSFGGSEWNASARLQLLPAHFAGLRVELGLGASVLLASPTANVTADSSTLLATGAFDLRLSRPFALGAFALAPSLGVRVFSGRRDVRVNDAERLVLPVLVPQAALWLVFPGD